MSCCGAVHAAQVYVDEHAQKGLCLMSCYHVQLCALQRKWPAGAERLKSLVVDHKSSVGPLTMLPHCVPTVTPRPLVSRNNKQHAVLHVVTSHSTVAVPCC